MAFWGHAAMISSTFKRGCHRSLAVATHSKHGRLAASPRHSFGASTANGVIAKDCKSVCVPLWTIVRDPPLCDTAVSLAGRWWLRSLRCRAASSDFDEGLVGLASCLSRCLGMYVRIEFFRHSEIPVLRKGGGRPPCIGQRSERPPSYAGGCSPPLRKTKILEKVKSLWRSSSCARGVGTPPAQDRGRSDRRRTQGGCSPPLHKTRIVSAALFFRL